MVEYNIDGDKNEQEEEQSRWEKMRNEVRMKVIKLGITDLGEDDGNGGS